MKKMIIGLLVGLVFAQVDMNQQIPFNNDVTTGKLDNGFTYYVLENTKPANRAELRLAVNIGSIDESDTEQGVAHFLEHMCFNGTERYPKNSLVDYLESLGMAFGPDLNAYTSFDRTVYMLQIPTDDTDKFSSAFEIMSEWASFVSLDGEEIDKERGVVKEEWRMRRGAGARIRDEQLPVVYGDSKYANRMPIGKMDVIENMSHETVQDFYKRWYRPDKMAIIAVGDFQTDEAMKLIQEYFGRIPTPVNPVEPGVYPVAEHSDKRVVISTDPEAQRASVRVTYKQKPVPQESVREYRLSLMHHLVNDMLGQRFEELVRTDDPPFVNAYAYKDSWIETIDLVTLFAMTDNEGISDGISALLTEIKRLEGFGFSEGELSRAKTRILAYLEQQYNDRDKTESRRKTNELIDHFLSAEPAPGISWEFTIMGELMESIDIKDVNNVAADLYSDNGIVVQISVPDVDNAVIPAESEILSIFEKVGNLDVEPYVDEVSDRPLLSEIPEAGSVEDEKYLKEVGLYEWILSNGARVIVKPTVFKNDEILFKAFAHGGNSATPKSEFNSGRIADSIIDEAGAGGFSKMQLDKLLTGKRLSVQPFINQYFHGIEGNSSPGDLETAMQLLYLKLTYPNIDVNSFQNLMDRYTAMVANRSNDPTSQYYDLINEVNFGNHYSKDPWSPEMLASVDLAVAARVYKERFANPANFTYLFVGSFDLPMLKKYVETYIGGLPNYNDEFTYSNDLGYRFPCCGKKYELYSGSEEKSKTRLTFYREMANSLKDQFYLSAATDVLEVRLRKILREEMGATYHVGVGTSTSQPSSDYTTAYIAFDSSPDNVKPMLKTIFREIKNLKRHAPEADEVQNVIEKYMNQRETNLESNKYWINALQGCYQRGVDPGDILKRDARIQSLTPQMIQSTIQYHFPRFRYTVVSLYPEKE